MCTVVGGLRCLQPGGGQDLLLELALRSLKVGSLLKGTSLVRLDLKVDGLLDPLQASLVISWV